MLLVITPEAPYPGKEFWLMNKFFQNLITSIIIGVVVYFFIYGMIYTQALANVPFLGELITRLTPTTIFMIASLFSVVYFCIYGLGSNGKSILAGIFLFLMVVYFFEYSDQIIARFQQFTNALMSIL